MSRLVVAVDARPLSHPHPGGFRSYVFALMKGLNERATAGEPIPRLLLYLDRPLAEETSTWMPQGAETRLLSADRLRTDFKLWRSQLRADNPDLVFGTQNYLPSGSATPSVLVLHDAMGIKQYGWDGRTPRTLKERLINRYWHYQTLASARKARRIVTVSEGAKSEIQSVLPRIPESRFVVVYNGVALPTPCYTGPRDSNTLLCIASPDRRKNLNTLYSSLANNREQFGEQLPNLRILCTSETTATRTRAHLAEHGLYGELLTGRDNQALADEYARATVFVWPSYLEGFGLPPLEMMATGGAVASSNAPSMPEVLGEVPMYFSPADETGLAGAVRMLLTNPELRHKQGELGRARSATFTCRRMADETLAVWEQAVRSP